MFFSSRIKQFHQVDISGIQGHISDFEDEDWEASGQLFRAATNGRPGRSVLLLTDLDPKSVEFWKENTSRGEYHVYRGPCPEKLFEDTLVLVKEQVLPLYPETEIARLQYAKLPSKARIPEHIDQAQLQFLHRLHIPIFTSDKVDFTISEKTYHLEEGRIYEINNILPHSVENHSAYDRTHLIIDLLPMKTGSVVVHPDYQSMRAAIRLDKAASSQSKAG